MRYAIALLVLLAACGKKKEESSANGESAQHTMADVKATEVTFKAPDNWIAEPPAGSLRKAQYQIPGKSHAGSAELAVFYFPGAGGSVEANLDRWYGQFKQPDGSSTKDKATTEVRDVNGLKVTVVSANGIYLKPVNPTMMGGPVTEVAGYALKAAIVETDGGPWFFKAVGPEETLTGRTDEFDQFVNTFSLK